ncbi:MAG: thymidine phosphorylase [Actinomycetota bacterium]|nr:thymidine phosphorylase [Actinomycetota bacterium]
MHIVDLIAAKRDGHAIGSDDLHRLVDGYTKKEIPDYQMSAFLMAGYLRGFDHEETVALTDAMLASGAQLDLSQLSGPTVDKHSTGGVGDSTTLVVAPLAAALGMQMIKLSGRGLGFTGGTLDKLESIPGMRTQLSARELIAQVDRIGLAVCAQTDDLVPADRAMYALRDVTATVGNTALIASSIMSKKLAGGAHGILLDVKVGSGAFMKNARDARELAEVCVALGSEAGRATRALITDMSQPLANTVGNAIEVRDAIEVLRGEQQSRFVELCLALVGHLAALSGVAVDAETGMDAAARALTSGAGLDRLRQLIEAQGGDPNVTEDTSLLPSAPIVHDIHAPQNAWLATVDTEGVGRASGALGAGREAVGAAIDPAVGLTLEAKIGDQVRRGEVIGRILARDEDGARIGEHAVLAALGWSPSAVAAPLLIHAVIDRASTGSGPVRVSKAQASGNGDLPVPSGSPNR